MAARTRQAWNADTRSDDELIAAAMVEGQLPEQEYDRASGAFNVLLWRSGPGLLQRASALTDSTDWMERELGVDLLGHIHDPGLRDVEERLAWSMQELVHGYVEETIPVLLALAETETVPDVVASLAWAFGHRDDPRGIAPLTRLVTHEAAHVREAVAHSLPRCWLVPNDEMDHEALEASRAQAQQIAAPLITLANDPEGDIRDWALFGLHGLELDTPEIRDTFFAHVDDPHHDAMTEALFGLANLGDLRGDRAAPTEPRLWRGRPGLDRGVRALWRRTVRPCVAGPSGRRIRRRRPG